MKKLEELGISPAPWKIGGNGCDVANAYNEIITGEYDQFSRADANFISAAPEVYERGVDLVSSLEDWMKKYPPSEFSTFGQAYQLLIEALNNFRAALAKASGESEVRRD